MSRAKFPGHSHYQNFPDIGNRYPLIGPGDPPPYMTYNDHGLAKLLVVADHAEFLGGIRQIHTRGIDTKALGTLDTLLAWLAEIFFRVILDDGYAMDLFDSFS